MLTRLEAFPITGGEPEKTLNDLNIVLVNVYEKDHEVGARLKFTGASIFQNAGEPILYDDVFAPFNHLHDKMVGSRGGGGS